MKNIIDDLKIQLDIAIKRLTNKIYYFSQGDDLISIDIAVQLRALLHDTGKSESLLNKLNLKSMDFIDSSSINYNLDWKIKEDDFNEVYGLVIPTLKEPVNESKYLPISIKESLNLVKFQVWWDENFIVRLAIKDKYVFFTRKDIILQMANKDGGAHYDDLSDNYSFLKHNYISTFKINGEFVEMSNSALYPTIVEIALEVIYTLIKAGYAKKNDAIDKFFD